MVNLKKKKEPSEADYVDKVIQGQSKLSMRLFLMFSAAVIVLGAWLWWRATVSDDRDRDRREQQECYMTSTEDFQRAVAEVLVVSIIPNSSTQLTPEKRERLLEALAGLEAYSEKDSTIECVDD